MFILIFKVCKVRENIADLFVFHVYPLDLKKYSTPLFFHYNRLFSLGR